MAFDYKKAYKDLYLPPRQPHILDRAAHELSGCARHRRPQRGRRRLPGMPWACCYGVAFTIKMSKLGSHSHGGLLRLCGTAPGGPVVAGA